MFDGLDFLGLLDTVAAAPVDSLNAGLAPMGQGIQDGDVFYNAATEIAPLEAWLNQPAPFDPSADPTVNLNFGQGAQSPGPGAPPNVPSQGSGFNMLVTAADYRFTLTNLTNYNADYFTVGDQWKLTIDGPPNVQIHAQAWFSGQNLGDNILGVTDQLGHFELTGVMGPDQVGAWLEEWYGNAELIQTVDFFVVAES